MIKAVNMKNYKFGKLGNKYCKGFGMIDTETGEFVSVNGFDPFTLRTKCSAQSCIDEGWPNLMKRVKPA